MHYQTSEPPYTPIADYAIIGDCRCAALISKSGSLDWLCLPRFHSPSLFAALLDSEKGGRFVIRPIGPCTIERRYIGTSNVLETTFKTHSGTLRLTDLMPIYSRQDRRRELCPERHVLRKVECLDGELEVEVSYEPRWNYGRKIPELKYRPCLGFFCEDGDQALALLSDFPLKLASGDTKVSGHIVLRRGERRYFSLTFAQGESLVIHPLGRRAEDRINQTLHWWKNWASRCTYQGPYRDAVIRSALTLKLLTYAPSGAVVAAPTTSLPEAIGGIRNWDYRYCWLRDASMTVRAFCELGFEAEGEAFLSWMLHTTRLTWPKLQVAYNVHGEPDLKEHRLENLQGYADSRPVRIGNDVVRQLQLDIYGAVIDAAYQFIRFSGRRIDNPTARLLKGLGNTVVHHWKDPDEGIWEIRAGRRHHTHSKVMCWVALDRLIKLHRNDQLQIPLQRFSQTRDTIREAIESRGYSHRLQSYVNSFDDETLDANLLLLPLYGYVDPNAPRMRFTYDRIREYLDSKGLLKRYAAHPDGLTGTENTFAVCCFWAAHYRARRGEIEEARRDFEYVLSFANDVGLFAEEIEIETGAALGNFPQAYSHVGLIHVALALAEKTGEITS